MQAAVRIARVLFVLLALIAVYYIWSADNGVPNALLKWLRGIRHGDKYVHFLLYGGLAFLLHIWLRGLCWRRWRLAVPVAAVVVLALGLGEEITQLYSPRRQFSGLDLASNLAGVLTFTLLAEALLRWLRRCDAGKPSAGGDCDAHRAPRD